MSRFSSLIDMGTRVRHKIRDIRERQADPETINGDLREYPDAYSVIFDAPGTAMENIHVRYVDGAVLAQIERYRNGYDGFQLVSGGRPLSFDGTVELPANADVEPEMSEAMIRSNGTLEVRLPKQDADVPADLPATRVD